MFALLGASIPRTARDIPIPFIGGAILLSTIPLFVIFYFFTKLWGVSAFAAVFMLFSGFLFSAVGAYMAGKHYFVWRLVQFIRTCIS